MRRLNEPIGLEKLESDLLTFQFDTDELGL